MSVLYPHAQAGRPRRLHGKGLFSYLIERKGVAPGLLLARLFLSALAGVLAIHFWRNDRG